MYVWGDPWVAPDPMMPVYFRENGLDHRSQDPVLFWHPDELRLYQPTTYVYGIKEKEEHGR